LHRTQFSIFFHFFSLTLLPCQLFLHIAPFLILWTRAKLEVSDYPNRHMDADFGNESSLKEHLQEFVKFYLTNLVFCQLLKGDVK
jgi:hypothetical protein